MSRSKKVIKSEGLEISVENIARYRKAYCFGYETEIKTFEYDSRSSNLHCFQGYEFTPDKLNPDPDDWRVLIILTVGVPENPHKEYLIKRTKKDDYFSFPKAEILENVAVSVAIDKPGNTNYSRSELNINRLVMLVPPGFCGYFIHSPQPSIFPQFRRLIIGPWDPNTANRSDTLSPQVSIVSNGAIIAPDEEVLFVG